MFIAIVKSPDDFALTYWIKADFYGTLSPIKLTKSVRESSHGIKKSRSF